MVCAETLQEVSTRLVSVIEDQKIVLHSRGHRASGAAQMVAILT